MKKKKQQQQTNKRRFCSLLIIAHCDFEGGMVEKPFKEGCWSEDMNAYNLEFLSFFSQQIHLCFFFFLFFFHRQNLKTYCKGKLIS